MSTTGNSGWVHKGCGGEITVAEFATIYLDESGFPVVDEWQYECSECGFCEDSFECDINEIAEWGQI